MAGVEQPAHGLFVHSKRLGERDAREPAVAEGNRERRLRRHAGRHRHLVLTGFRLGRLGDELAVVNAPGQRLGEGVGGGGEGRVGVRARRQALREVTERDV